MTEVNRKIHVIGINSYIFEDLPLTIQNLFIDTVNVAVPNSYYLKIKSWSKNKLGKKKSFFVSESNIELVDWLRSQKTDVILISRGDPLWFGIGRILLENFQKDELSFYPSNTCIQMAFSKLKIPWQESITISIHGRETDQLIRELKSRTHNLAIIPDPKKNNIELIRRNLLELQVENFYEIWICEELGFKNEKITKLNKKINN